MNNNNLQPAHRRSIRLKGYDYSSPGSYFVTLVCWRRKCLFGEIVRGKMRLNSLGNIIKYELQKIGDHFQHISLENFVIMPNHLHTIITINEDSIVGATRPSVNEILNSTDLLGKGDEVNLHGSPLRHIRRSNGPAPGSIGAIVGQFKSRATKRIWELPEINQQPVWQRNYYEHIIRNEKSLEDIYRYIIGNPEKWAEDEYYSE